MTFGKCFFDFSAVTEHHYLIQQKLGTFIVLPHLNVFLKTFLIPWILQILLEIFHFELNRYRSLYRVKFHLQSVVVIRNFRSKVYERLFSFFFVRAQNILKQSPHLHWLCGLWTLEELNALLALIIGLFEELILIINDLQELNLFTLELMFCSDLS